MFFSIILTASLLLGVDSLSCNVRSCSKTYKVVAGDYPYLISQKIGVPLSNLSICNPELLSTSLWVGQVLCTSCSVASTPCTCSNYINTQSSNTWSSIADSHKMTIGYLSDCNANANIPATQSVPSGLRLCVKCRISDRKFTISPYYEAVVASLNANIGSLSSSGLKATTFAFITGSGTGTNAVPSWESVALSSYSSVVTGFTGLRTISFGGSEAGAELAIKFASANGTAAGLAAKYSSIVRLYGSSITLDFDIEGGDILNTAANTLRAKALKIIRTAYPGVKVTYTLPVGPSGLTSGGVDLILNSIANGVTPSAVNIMVMNYGAPDRGLNYDVKAIEAAYLQLVTICSSIKLGVTPMIGKDDSGAIRTVADMDALLRFATTKPTVIQFGYWAYHRDVPGTVGVAPCSTLSYCAGITGFTKGDYRRKFLDFSA